MAIVDCTRSERSEFGESLLYYYVLLVIGMIINNDTCTFTGNTCACQVLWIEVGGFERSVFVWVILRVRHSPLSSIIMHSCYNHVILK